MPDDELTTEADELIAHYAADPWCRAAMMRALVDACQRPLARVLGDAAQCAFCGAARGEACRLWRNELGPAP